MINLLDEIGEPGFQSAAFLTYGVDLGFFETKVMNRLLETGCRNVLVIADGHQTKDAVNTGAQLRHVGVQCPLITVRLGNRAFHPKAVLMAGEEKLKVLVGSGNLTIPGYTRNWEMFTKLEGAEAATEALELLGVFEAAAALSPLESAFHAWRRRLENSTPWLFGESTTDHLAQLLCSAAAPILPRVGTLLDGLAVDEILVASPFFDADASALRWLADNFSPNRLTLLVEDGAYLDPARMDEVLSTMGDRSAVRRFLGSGRPLHGKLVLFKGSWGEALLAGSPNVSSAALLKRSGRSTGNFELATFRWGVGGEFSALVDAKVGEPVNLQQINARRPQLISPTVSPLELETAWVSEGSFHAVPAEKILRGRPHVNVAIDQRGHEVARLELYKAENGSFSSTLADEERLRMERAPAKARLLDSNGEHGVPVWVQNLDAVEKRANPVQPARYARGLQALENGSLGPDWESWNSIFNAFNALSKSWLRYADMRRTTVPKPATKSESQTAWDPELFYISRDEVTLELPRYFAKADNTGVAIGDFEYLISALPTAQRSVDGEASFAEESTDALSEDESLEGAEAEEDTDAEVIETDPPIPHERRLYLRKRLYKKFRAIIDSYEDAISQAEAQNTAEASYLCLPYPALQKAIVISVREGLLDVWQFRELASWLTAVWVTNLRPRLPDSEDLEGRLACEATSLATVATVTSPWLRYLAHVDEFDEDLYQQLRETLKVLRPVYLSLMEDYESGESNPAWEKLITEYNKLRHVELREEYFASWTALQVLDDLAARYRSWRIDEASLCQRAADDLGISGCVLLDGDVMRIYAPLPRVGDQDHALSRLLFSIHEGTESPAAVLWDNEDRSGKIRTRAMVLCPETNVVLEISLFSEKRPLLRLHRAAGGSAGNGVYLIKSTYQTIIWKQGLIHPNSNEQEVVLKFAAKILPELPLATDLSS